MYKKILLLVLISIVTLPISFTTVNAYAGEERTIYLSATEYDYPPFSITDNGEADGFSVELLKAVAEEIGITVTFKIDQWTTLKEELRTGELDILPLVGYTPERDEFYDFTVPYIVMRGNIFVRSNDESIKSQVDLFGKEVLVLDGDNSQEWAWSIGLEDELTATSTYAEAFKLLAAGEYDAVLAQGLVGEKIISDENLHNVEPVYIYENGGATRLKLNLEGYEQKFCFAVVEGDAELLSILNEGLVIVSANGTYDELFHKWFPFLIEKEEVSPYEIAKIVLYILAPLLITLLGIYVMIVKKSVRNKTNQIEKNNYGNKIIVDAFQVKFHSATERYDYVLGELIILTESVSGFIFTYDQKGNINIRACCSNLTSKKCTHEELKKLIEENVLLKSTLESTKPIVSNDYENEYPNSGLTICGQDVFRLIAIPVKRIDGANIVVLVNKKTNFSEDNINQTSILMTGLWNMLEKEDQNEKVEFMSFHDSLTGLYNRRFFEEEMRRLDNPRNYPITIAMGDVNGLKLVNDAFGHNAGDQLLINVGDLLKKHCRANDIVARWGGDEFIIILPNTSLEDSENLLNRIQRESVEMNDTYGLTSIAFGADSKDDDSKDINEVFLSAEDLMYKNKLEMIDSVRGETITTVLNTLFEKSPAIKEHSERVSSVAVSIANQMGLSKNVVADIKTIGIIHDIGKIVIDLSILDSPNKLSDEERKIINMHPLSGSRMLSSTHEYTRLSAGVLHHHERWDGTGYPNGIKGDSIPLEARIIAVADAYDAMISERPYKAVPFSKEKAILEISDNKGTQFDPNIVDHFILAIMAGIVE